MSAVVAPWDVKSALTRVPAQNVRVVISLIQPTVLCVLQTVNNAGILLHVSFVTKIIVWTKDLVYSVFHPAWCANLVPNVFPVDLSITLKTIYVIHAFQVANNVKIHISAYNALKEGTLMVKDVFN